jgi:hypothetical protein
MTVYVDHSPIGATAGQYRSPWSQLFADSQDELHAFPERLGLRRQWFQPGEPPGGKPSAFLHYDLTAGKRAQSIRLGATPVTWHESARIRERGHRYRQVVASGRVTTGERHGAERFG